jgi:hypothetical protein
MVGELALSAGVILALSIAAPAFADCASAMKSNDEMMTTSTGTPKKEAAMKEESMAKGMMDKNDEAGCMTHADKAMKIIK